MGKKSSPKLVEERLWLLDELEKIIDGKNITEQNIATLIQPWDVSGRRNFLHNIAKFLNDYAKFIKRECPSLTHVADVISKFYLNRYEDAGREAVQYRKKEMLQAPENFTVNLKLLNGLTNEQFVNAFRVLQLLVIDIYTDIEKAPFDWGYPDFDATDGYYNRVIDILFMLAPTVDAKDFFANNNIKRHKKVELMIAGFNRMGFVIEGFDKKTEAFTVAYPASPHVLVVLYAYAKQVDINEQEWKWQPHANSLSYRYVEDPATQKYEAVFLADMDYRSPQLFEVQCWLHDQATKYGFKIDENKPMEKGCILYQKGSKRFLLVGEKEQDGKIIIWSKASFIDTFEKAPGKIRVLCDRFPHVFKLDDPGKCCHENKCMFRMSFKFGGISYLRCGLANFVFEDITLEDVSVILDAYLVENKITPQSAPTCTVQATR